MTTNEEKLLHLLREYQKAHKTEKIQLLHLPEVRLELLKRIKHYEQTGRAKRMSREKLGRLLTSIENPVIDPSEFLPLLHELRFPLDFWNHFREIADDLPQYLTSAWQLDRQRACNLRNEILEETAFLVPKVRRINFTMDPQRIDDADGNGFLGLLKAIDNFTQEEGRSFEAYAKVYILNQIVCFLRNDKLVKPSDTLRRFYSHHDSVVEELRQSLGREPTTRETAEALDIDPEELIEKQEHRGFTLSLDAQLGEEEDTTLHDAIGQEAALPYERMENHLIVDRLHHAMKRLSQAESMVVSLRWTPYHDCQLIGPIHRAPAAYERMRLWSLKLIEEGLRIRC